MKRILIENDLKHEFYPITDIKSVIGLKTKFDTVEKEIKDSLKEQVEGPLKDEIRESLQDSLKDELMEAILKDLGDKINGSPSVVSMTKESNVDSSVPLELDFYLPSTKVLDSKLKLVFRKYRKNFSLKSYASKTYTSKNNTTKSVTTTLSGGKKTTTSRDGSYSSSTGYGGYDSGRTSDNSSSISVGSRSLSGSTSGLATGVDQGWYSTTDGPGHEHKYRKTTNHGHDISISSHNHPVTVVKHDHSYSVDSHTHSFSIGGHTHSVELDDHQHTFTMPAHTHEVVVGSHNHDYINSISEVTSSNRIKISINSKDLTSSLGGGTTGFNDDKELTIPTSSLKSGWNNIKLTSTSIGRVSASLHVEYNK